jgi:hypothetical protein
LLEVVDEPIQALKTIPEPITTAAAKYFIVLLDPG